MSKKAMKLVPVEPTQKMLDAPPNAYPADALVTWKAMLAAAPQPAQQEPVGEVVLEGLIGDSQVVRFHMYKEIPPVGAKLYTSPPAQRTWVGLTDEEMEALWDRYAHMEMMRAIEAKLKEKNT